jgi:DNA repair exonuclease SbcCD nuclease subunit
MKFLHTADWQIGMKASHIGEAGKRVRDQRIEAIRNVINVAHENQVDFILVAGDTFEDNGVDRILVQKVADILAKSKTPIYIIPGNHDPLVPGSVWDHPVWKSTENVSILREETPVDIPGGILFPCPILEKHSGKNPTLWIPDTGEGIRIGLAHGTVEGIPTDELEYPISRNAAAQKRLDYLALGHWHSFASYPGSDGAVHMAYSGTHEPTKFGERDSGNVLIVEISNPGAAPIVTPVPTGKFQWDILACELREAGNLSQFREEIEAIENPEATLIDLRISGIIPAEEYAEFERIQQIVSSRFLFSHVDFTNVRPSPEDESWVANLPAGIIRETGGKLQELANPDYTGDRPEGASPEVASRALIELYALISEVAS